MITFHAFVIVMTATAIASAALLIILLHFHALGGNISGPVSAVADKSDTSEAP